MADKRITTELVVRAVDQYSGMLRTMSGTTGRFAEKVRSEMKQLQGLRGPLQMIRDHKTLHSTFGRSEAELRKSRERVKALRLEMKATGTPTKKMVRDFERAQNAAERLRLAHAKNGTALSQLQGKMRTAGINTSDLGSEQSRLTRELDAANAAFARQADRMQRLTVMQDRIAAGRERMDRSLATAANLSFVGQATAGVGGRILSKTSDIADTSGGQQAAFTEFQNLTGVDDDRIAKLRDELGALRDVTKTSVDDMLEGLGVLVGKGMDLEAALGALPATARAAFATETGNDQMGAAGFALYSNLNIAPEELTKAYDIMAMAGKEGGFELTAMARKFPEVTAGARALGLEGLNAAASLSAALQIAMNAAGSEDQAATNMANFFGKITAPDTVKKFHKFGVNIEQEMRGAIERGADPMEHMLEVIEKMTGGDAFKMGELFADKQVLDFLRAMLPNMQEYARIKEAALGADGVIDADLARRMRDFNVQKGQLGESLGRLFTLPPEALETLTAMLVSADAFVEKLIVWKDEHPGFAKAVFLGATALGAMAVAGGTLLTVGAGLIGTLAVLRFGLVGLGARGAFAAGSLTGVGGAFRGLMRLPKFPLSKLLTGITWGAALIPKIGKAKWISLAGRFALGSLLFPVSWTARYIGKIPWAILAGGKFALSGLIMPLKWTAKLLPNFAPALARFAAFRIAATAQMAGLSLSAAWHSKLIGGAFATGFTKFLLRGGAIGTGLALGLGVKPVENAELTPQGANAMEVMTQADADRMALDVRLRRLEQGKDPAFIDRVGRSADLPAGGEAPRTPAPIIPRPEVMTSYAPSESPRPVGRPDEESRELLALDRQISALERIRAIGSEGPLPTTNRLQEVREAAASLREEIAGMRAEIDALGQGPAAAMLAVPHQTNMAARTRELQDVEAELETAQGQSADLTAALQVLDATNATPEISTESIDLALAKVQALSAKLRALPTSGTGSAPALKPAGERALGGPVRGGLPYLVNERTANSEWFVPSVSGGILNVGQAQAAFKSHLPALAPRRGVFERGAQRVRAAGLAGLASSALVSPAAAMTVTQGAGSRAGGASVTVTIEGPINIAVPAGVTDPQRIAELTATLLGQQIEATYAASYSD